MFKRILPFLLVLALMVGSTAFAEESADYDFKIGYTVLGNATNFFVNVNNSLETACEEKGIEFSWTINDRDASKMRTAIDTYVMQGADIIVDFTVLVETGTAIAAELAKEGIPMISIDCAYEGAYFFGVDNAGAGKTIGQFAADWVTENWDGQIDSVQGLYNEAAGELVRQRVSCGMDVLVEQGLVSADNLTYTNTNSSGATTTDVSYVRSLVVDYLTAHPDDEHIVLICMTDEVATAANAAAISTGREDNVAIVSHNCDLAVVEMLQQESGCIIGTVNYNSNGYGEQIVDACATILKAQETGEELDWYFYNKVYVVSRENAWEYYPEAVVY